MANLRIKILEENLRSFRHLKRFLRKQMKKVAVILSGCGYLDGSEIRESVLTLLALDTANIEYQILRPTSLCFMSLTM